MPFDYTRIVRFQDTDAAGVVYFANLLAMCHEAYEASLAASGIDLKTFFKNERVAVPIVQSQSDFFRPLFCGDRVRIELTAKLLSEDTFETHYQFFVAGSDRAVVTAMLKHVVLIRYSVSTNLSLIGYDNG